MTHQHNTYIIQHQMFQNEDKNMILIFLVVFWGKPIRDKAEGQYTNDINEENGCIINIKAK